MGHCWDRDDEYLRIGNVKEANPRPLAAIFHSISAKSSEEIPLTVRQSPVALLIWSKRSLMFVNGTAAAVVFGDGADADADGIVKEEEMAQARPREVPGRGGGMDGLMSNG